MHINSNYDHTQNKLAKLPAEKVVAAVALTDSLLCTCQKAGLIFIWHLVENSENFLEDYRHVKTYSTNKNDITGLTFCNLTGSLLVEINHSSLQLWKFSRYSMNDVNSDLLKLKSTTHFGASDQDHEGLNMIRSVHVNQSLCIVTFPNEIKICNMHNLKIIKVLLPIGSGRKRTSFGQPAKLDKAIQYYCRDQQNNSRNYVVACYSQSLMQWNTASGQFVQKIEAHGLPLTALTLIHLKESNIQLFASASGEFTVKLWDPYRLICLMEIKESGHVYSLASSIEAGILVLDRFSTGRNQKRGLGLWQVSQSETRQLETVKLTNLLQVEEMKCSYCGQLLNQSDVQVKYHSKEDASIQKKQNDKESLTLPQVCECYVAKFYGRKFLNKLLFQSNERILALSGQGEVFSERILISSSTTN